MLDASSFTAGQITFIERLAGDTGLDAGVIAAWVYQEENGSAAQGRQSSGNHNWLNIGYFNSGPGQIAFNHAFGNPTTAADQTNDFLRGTWGGASSGIRAILNSVGQPPATQIRAIQTSGWATSGETSMPSIFASLSPSFKSQLTSKLVAGGVFGLGGTGSPANQSQPSLWTVGDSSNPDQDYWTTINQYSQNAQLYCFSDGESLFIADGIQLMAQTPQAVISRLDPAIVSVNLTYDNTAFNFTSSRIERKRNKPQRRATLQRLASPTGVQIELICDIDAFRGGDVVYLQLFGPADGLWLLGDVNRSIFGPTSKLTLVQAMAPINAASGLPLGPQFLTGPGASAPTSGTVIAAMLAEANTLNKDDYNYVWGGGHSQAGTPSIGVPGGNGYDGHTKGFDCSGAVGAVLAAGGILTWGASVPGSNSIVDELLAQNKVIPGSGSLGGTTTTPAPSAASQIPGIGPECTLHDSPDHIFMRLNGEYWGTADGVGNLPATPNQGVGWIPNGQPGTGFRITHIPKAILGQQAGATTGGGTGG